MSLDMHVVGSNSITFRKKEELEKIKASLTLKDINSVDYLFDGEDIEARISPKKSKTEIIDQMKNIYSPNMQKTTSAIFKKSENPDNAINEEYELDLIGGEELPKKLSSTKADMPNVDFDKVNRVIINENKNIDSEPAVEFGASKKPMTPRKNRTLRKTIII